MDDDIRFEYKVLVETSPSSLEELLNEMNKVGWELDKLTETREGYTAVFSRWIEPK